ncbi:hypothetical protein [Flavobacteriaceae bacterium 14752]|uniref:hypothetical protein n=1 Tax=Mesohalobacter salilacus TaxID=2491711 RepID=UPI000F63B602|nr:hypothetical protein EIG84_01045 [Flavobacteriaceae bacterium 14752]
MSLNLKYLFFLSFIFLTVLSCSNEPFEGELISVDPDVGTGDENPDDEDNEEPAETIYATAKLDGEPFVGNLFEVENINENAIRLSFFSDLQQQIYLILSLPPVVGVFDVTSTENSEFVYSGAFVNSVGNVSESTFNSIANSGTIEILNYNSQTGKLSGKFAFDVVTFNNNGIVISDGEFEVILE